MKVELRPSASLCRATVWTLVEQMGAKARDWKVDPEETARSQHALRIRLQVGARKG